MTFVKLAIINLKILFVNFVAMLHATNNFLKVESSNGYLSIAYFYSRFGSEVECYKQDY